MPGPSALREVIKSTDPWLAFCVHYQETKVNSICACLTTEQATLGFYLLKWQSLIEFLEERHFSVYDS